MSNVARSYTTRAAIAKRTPRAIRPTVPDAASAIFAPLELRMRLAGTAAPRAPIAGRTVRASPTSASGSPRIPLGRRTAGELATNCARPRSGRLSLLGDLARAQVVPALPALLGDRLFVLGHPARRLVHRSQQHPFPQNAMKAARGRRAAATGSTKPKANSAAFGSRRTVCTTTESASAGHCRRRIRAALRPTPGGILGSPYRDHAVAARRKLAHVIGGKSSS